MEKLSYQPRYTVDDYLTWEGDWELWNGLPVSMSPSASELHQVVAGRLYQQLANQLEADNGCRCRVLFELDWHLDRENVRRPNLMILCNRPIGQIVDHAPTLVAEIISPKTAQKDRIAKRFDYARHGARFYLIVDPQARRLEMLELLDDAYQPTSGPLELHDGCRVTIDADRLWP